MDRRNRSPPQRDLWTYAYQILPPQSDIRLAPIRAVLDQEHADAHRADRTWGAYIVTEPEITRILVVSDSPEQDGRVNQHLHAALRGLEAVFSMSAALRVVDDGGPEPHTH